MCYYLKRRSVEVADLYETCCMSIASKGCLMGEVFLRFKLSDYPFETKQLVSLGECPIGDVVRNDDQVITVRYNASEVIAWLHKERLVGVDRLV